MCQDRTFFTVLSNGPFSSDINGLWQITQWLWEKAFLECEQWQGREIYCGNNERKGQDARVLLAVQCRILLITLRIILHTVLVIFINILLFAMLVTSHQHFLVSY